MRSISLEGGYPSGIERVGVIEKWGVDARGREDGIVHVWKRCEMVGNVEDSGDARGFVGFSMDLCDLVLRIQNCKYYRMSLVMSSSQRSAMSGSDASAGKWGTMMKSEAIGTAVPFTKGRKQQQ